MTLGPLLRVTIPGHWSDGWLYKDHLFLWAASGELVQTPVSRIVTEVRETHGEDTALAAQIALFRNDWKRGLQTTALTRVPGVRAALRSVAAAAENLVPLVISTGSFESVDIEAVPGFLLSVSVYGNHAFIASSDGLFETNLNPAFLHQERELLQRIDVPVHAVETNYGAMAASAFEEGLWFDRIDFGEGSSWLGGGPLDRVAEYSRGVSMASRDLLNFTDDAIPDLYIAESRRDFQNDSSRYKSWQVTGYSRSPVELVALTASGLGLSDDEVNSGGVRLLANSNQRLLYDVDGSLQILRLKTLSNISLESADRLDIRLDDVTVGNAPVSALPLSDGFLIETMSQVTWINGNGIVEVSDSPAVNLRTFPNSKHFDDVALIVEEESTTIVGFLDFP